MPPGMQRLNKILEDQNTWLEQFALATQESFGAIERRFELIDNRFAEVDRRFDKMDERIDTLTHEVYSNGDALARIIKTMDQEFAASRIQMNRLEGRVERLEHAQGLA